MERNILSAEFTLEDFLENLTNRLSGIKCLDKGTVDEIFTQLHDLLDPHAIKFSHDSWGVLEAQAKLRESFPKEHIPSRLRLVLKTRRTKSDYRHEMVRISNGMVIAIEEGKGNAPLSVYVLARPVNEVNQNQHTPSVDHYLRRRDYEIYPIRDGTVLTLYYDPQHCYAEGEKLRRGRWYYGSRNAYNVEGIAWRGFSYQEVLEQLAQDYPKFAHDKLDPEYTYTLGFKHPAFHPFNQPDLWNSETSARIPAAQWKREMWLIGAIKRDGSELTKPEIGIPVQRPIEIELDRATINKYKNLSLGVLLGLPEHQPEQLPPECEKFVRNGRPIFLGYILRLKDVARKADPNCAVQDVILESCLWEEIRKMIYETPRGTTRDKRCKAIHFRDVNYMVLHNYMNQANLPHFRSILPQYAELYAQQAKRVSCVVDMIYEKLSETSLKERNLSSRSLSKCSPREIEELRSTYEGLADQLAPIISRVYTVAKRSRNKNQIETDRNIIRGLLVNLKYLDIFYEGLYPK